MHKQYPAPFGALVLGPFLGLFCSVCPLDAAPLLRAAGRHVTGSSAKCEVVQKTLAEAEEVLGVVRRHGGAASTDSELNSMLTKLNGTVLRSNAALMGSKNMNSLASQLRRESSLLLNGLLQSAANEAPNPTTKEFLRTLRLCAHCEDYERVGEYFDGGYIICADGLANSGLAGAYSYGINGYDGWGMDLAQRFKIPLFEYDCFDARAPEPCHGCDVKFFPQCIEGNRESKSSSAFFTFTEHVANNGQANSPRSSILLKIDVEGAEWNVFAQENATSLRQVRQITTELHNIGNEHMHALYLKAMRSLLEAGFAVTHLHGNNHGPMLHYGPYSVPAVLEVSLVRRPENSPKECPEDIPYSIPEDQRCDFWKPELPNAKLPS